MSYTFIIAILQNYFLIHLPIQTFLLFFHDSLALPSSIICTFLSYHTTCSYILLCHHLSPSPILPSLLYSYTILCNIKSYYPLCYPYSFSSYLIGPSKPLFHQYSDRVASVIVFSVLCLFSVGSLCVTFFLILLQYNIRPPSPNRDMCDPEFAARVNIRRYDTSTRTVLNVMMIFHWELS